MNWAHVHLLVNHIPVIGSLGVTLLLAYAIWRGGEPLIRVSMGFLVVVALAGVGVYFTGEPAAETIEPMHLPGVTQEVIERHEEAAELSTIVLGLSGAVALLGLLRYRTPRTLPRWYTALTFVAALAGVLMMARTANFGGMIRHTEIRAHQVVQQSG